uniref:Uncharacterized protein n=1 Tax=Coccolithus braarudii TaxID=221442 RepID=A0A7S0Q7Q9_9EUKA|mmetsp:Transcript_9388/g.20471  ORF Transcript_9388/g.20471 Transcript_9388/m.20471 type:complete len:267 (+) Transcript_9388:63-863(+)|eukprot:CAMPEP_0183338234 /NCGR_PEP_ID=MMETSP0164_2-20130417/5602_1 /TAXON_ID=221442 /ORGANISM="Coccolithus pelagicus ssp braarudi, Strain PLY182g" /LENGTH=266 /DNA_ID=CAMNT_0025508053 /DNA_START=63 /DNA_END=863 /DNA_ORIENTATION=+
MTELSEEVIQEWLRLHLVVRSAAVLPHEPPKTIGGLQCRLWCKGCAVRSSGIENVQFLTATRTTLTACLPELEKKLSKHGVDCEARVAATKAAAEQQQSSGAGSSRAGSSGTAEDVPPDALCAMTELASAETRAKAANEAALGVRLQNGESALKVQRWFHRTDDDASGCTFIEWDLKKDSALGAPPVAMIINSCKKCAVFGVEKFKKVTPPPLDLGAAGRTRGGGARVRQLEGVVQDLDQVRYIFNPETDEVARDACIACGAATPT